MMFFVSYAPRIQRELNLESAQTLEPSQVRFKDTEVLKTKSGLTIFMSILIIQISSDEYLSSLKLT
jgi:hypothetical protein